jgi:uncharacterized repeat protein (TIGR03803 family)
MTTTERLLGLVGMLGALAIVPMQAQTEIVLHKFSASTGYGPEAGVIRDSAGNLYGTTPFGGAGSSGVVYKLDAARHYTALYSFTGGADGGGPNAGVILDSAGNLYGTTYGGGTANAGVVYKLDTAGNYTVLHSFTEVDSEPYAGVTRDSAGNLYGTTAFGGARYGVVYKLDTTGNYTVLHNFTGADGAIPRAGVVLDSVGNLYGTASSGGASAARAGVVYKLDTTGNYTVLHSFTGADGDTPLAGVILDSAGNLYGTTSEGGTTNNGVVYKLDTTGHYRVLYCFTVADGASPFASVIRNAKGKLYGTTVGGGKKNDGVIFEIKP